MVDSATTDEPAVPPADDKDWTWVLDETCADCGFDAAAITGRDVPDQVRVVTGSFLAALASPSVAQRPEPEVWSTLEYACHIRDVMTHMAARARLMLTQDNPVFANWDQDLTAVEERYWEQDPAVVARQLQANADDIAAVFAGVTDDQWARPGTRSNGSLFTVDSLGRYFVHDIVHHAHDIDATPAP